MKQTKTILSMLCAAALFAACSSTDELEPVVQTGQQTAEEAVGFDVYTRGTQVTRAGYVGEMDQTAIRVAGFGVYGYVTSGNGVSAAQWSATGSSATPVFMSNQPVNYAGDKWTYSPVKYWPNQADVPTTGKVDDLDGGTALNTGTDINLVSFFAYAPYVDKSAVTAYTGAASEDAVAGCAGTGIVYIPDNTATSDPCIGYKVETVNTMNTVDLMYGVAAHQYDADNRYTGKAGNDVTAGKPFLDMTKEMVGDKVDYKFEHALTKLAVYVDAYFDEVRTGSNPSALDVDPNTRIVIKSVKLTTTDLCTSGLLNLNNTTADYPLWTFPTTAPTLNAQDLPIASNLLYIGGTPEENVTYFAKQPLGVTKTKQPLFGYGVDGTTPASLMFIPNGAKGTAQDLTIAIDYYVITRDTRLQKGYSVVENNITNTITAGELKFDAGYSYTLNLHLGMTTVKFDATVADWNGGASGDIDLPANVAVKSVSGAAIDKYGKITLTTPKATLQNNNEITLTINDVYFTDAQNNVLPIKTVSTDNYYISGNYTGSARDIKMWYGGVAQTVSQPTLDYSDITSVTATVAAGSKVGGDGADKDYLKTAGGTVTITVAMDGDKVKDDFNCDDWTLSATNCTFTEVTTDNAAKTWTVTVNPTTETSSDPSIVFTVTHKVGTAITKSATAITQMKAP